MGAQMADIIAEGRRLVGLTAAQGVPLRLLGGVAVRLRCPDAAAWPELSRSYQDLDIVAPRRAARTLRELLLAQGYEPDDHFNALHGASRLLFFDQSHGRQVDVFLSVFAMCHKLDLEPRLALPGPALPAADLLLLKLQIVQLNYKDITDALTLLGQFEPMAEDDPAALSAGYIARLCANDWGWYTTLHDNLAAVRQQAGEILAAPERRERVQARIDALLAAMEQAPKSVGWRLRDKIGRRKVWYELPEEVDR